MNNSVIIEIVEREYDKKCVVWQQIIDPTIEYPGEWKDSIENFPKLWTIVGVYDYLLTPFTKNKTKGK
jgi:hypothetical protein